jgi:hypothetical protein
LKSCMTLADKSVSTTMELCITREVTKAKTVVLINECWDYRSHLILSGVYVKMLYLTNMAS